MKWHLWFSFSVFRQDSHLSLWAVVFWNWFSHLAVTCLLTVTNPAFHANLQSDLGWSTSARQCNPSCQTPKGQAQPHGRVLQRTSTLFTAALKLSWYIHCWRQKKNQCLRAWGIQCWSQPLSKQSWLCSRVHIILEWQRWNSCYLCNWREGNERRNVTAFTAFHWQTDYYLKLSVHWGRNELKAKSGIQTAGEQPRTWSAHKGSKKPFLTTRTCVLFKWTRISNPLP